MRKLNDQWIEVIDGQEHMVKAVEPIREFPEMECGGCFFDTRDACLRIESCPKENLIVKDLGILRNGMLPCPFCGEYPRIVRNSDYCWYACCNCDCQLYPNISEQEAKNDWNRRS